MNGKTTKVKPKMADVTKPKKLTTADELVIQSRPMVGRATSVSSPVDEEKMQDDALATAPVLPSQSKRTLIVPVSDGGESDHSAADTTPAAAASAASDTKVSVSTGAPKGAAPVAPAGDKKADTPAAEAPVKTDKEAAPAANEKAAPADDDDEAAADDVKTDDTDDKPNPETEKALKEAAAAEKRLRDLEFLIDSKQFYVPINAVARKRSIKYSSVMTVFVFLLAIVLIDLMLDSGTILLVQKIPHTHFFSTSSQNG
jgi:hypothetical protein